MDKNYKRPKITYTDTLQSEEEINKQLEGYYDVQFDDIKRGDNIRYISYCVPKKKYMYRIGGIVTSKGYGKIKLRNDKGSYYWSLKPFVLNRR